MGLDMFLAGRKSTHWDIPKEERPKEDGFVVSYKALDLGYWRKHPDLHGYILETCAPGEEDTCQEVYVTKEHLQQIIDRVKQGPMPTVQGFFFGDSSAMGYYEPEEIQRTVNMLQSALDWLTNAPKSEMRDVYYQASW